MALPLPEHKPALTPAPQHPLVGAPLVAPMRTDPQLDECGRIGLAMLRKHALGVVTITWQPERRAWVTGPGADHELLPKSVLLVLEALGWTCEAGNRVAGQSWWDPERYESIWIYPQDPTHG